MAGISYEFQSGKINWDEFLCYNFQFLNFININILKLFLLYNIHTMLVAIQQYFNRIKCKGYKS